MNIIAAAGGTYDIYALTSGMFVGMAVVLLLVYLVARKPPR